MILVYLSILVIFIYKYIIYIFTQRVGFGYNPRGRYTPGISNDPLCQHHSDLCGLILLESLDLEWLLQNQDNPTELVDERIDGGMGFIIHNYFYFRLQKHHLSDNSRSQHVKVNYL